MNIVITRTRLIIAAALVAAIGIAVLLNYLIVTDKDRVKASLKGLAAAIEKNDVEAVMPFVDNSFRLSGMDPEAFRAWYADLLKAGLVVKKVAVYDATVEIDKNDPAVATVAAQILVSLKSPRDYESNLDWRLEFRRRGDKEWKLVGARAYWPINGMEIPLTAVRNLLSF